MGATARVTVSNACSKLTGPATEGSLEAVAPCDSATIAPAQIVVTSNLIDVFKNDLSGFHVGPVLPA